MPIAIHSYKFRYAKVLLVALSLAFHFDMSAPIGFSLYDSINKNKETEPIHTGFISLFNQPVHRYRTSYNRFIEQDYGLLVRVNIFLFGLS